MTPTPRKTAVADALAMLARRDYSCAGLRDKLRAKGHVGSDVDTAIERCAEWGYLDDHRFGRARAEGRLRRRPGGRIDAVRDLRRQGLTETMSEAVVDEVLSELGGESGLLDDAIRRWMAQHGEPGDIKAAKRCFDHLQRRSFPHHLIMQKLSPWLDDINF